MKKLILFANLVAIMALGYQWYQGLEVPAWVALIWCVAATVHDLENYLEGKYAKNRD